MKKILVSFLAILVLSGCSDPTPEEQLVKNQERADSIAVIDAYNERSLTKPNIVGKTASGAVVSRSHIKFVCDSCSTSYPQDHYVYMINGITSDNYSYRSGKRTIKKVEVALSENPSAEQIIAEGERLRKSIEDADLAELARLKEKYPNQ